MSQPQHPDSGSGLPATVINPQVQDQRSPSATKKTSSTAPTTKDTGHGQVPSKKVSQARMKPPPKEKPPKLSLPERLPPGVYDNRPRQKRYILHWLYFWLYARLGLYKTKLPVPQAAKHERLQRNIAFMFEESKTKQFIFACLNSSGGAGKTTIATWLAVMLATATKRSVILEDANENKGATAKRLGIRREDTVQLRTFLRYEKELSSADQIHNALAIHESGVLVIASEAQDKSSFSQRLFEARNKTLKRTCHILGLDAGNGVPYAANRGSIAIADVNLFPGTIRKEESIEDIEDTRQRYAANEKHYGFTDKVEQSIIPLLGVSEKQRLAFIEEFGWNPDKVFRVRSDRFMMGRHVVSWKRISIGTRLDLSNIGVEMFKSVSAMPKWDAQADDSQHNDELDLTEVQYMHDDTSERR